MHPLVAELVNNDLEPNRGNCGEVFQYFERRIQKSIDISTDTEAEAFEFEAGCELLCAFFSSLDVCSKENRDMVINWCLQLIDQNFFGFSPYDSDFRLLFAWLQKVDDIISPGKYEAFTVKYLLFVFWLSSFDRMYVVDAEEEIR